VDVFRPGPKTPEYAEKAAQQGAKVLWLQLGITNPETRELAESFGLEYFENVCTGEVVKRLGITAPAKRNAQQ
ncbi:MAG: CoA-binding protein, partial [Microbacteriaceae bacterium]